MKIKPFAVEEWMNANEDDAKYNIAETCVDSVSMQTLFQLAGEDLDSFLAEFSQRRLTYGAITGREDFVKGICSLYKTLQPANILTTHGAAGANHLLFYSLIEPGDRVISVQPTYQQLYSIPESFGARVDILPLLPENGFQPDLALLRKLTEQPVKLICINNPNNPSGALMQNETLQEIVKIARASDAWLLCDEVYRGLTQDDIYIESIADLYEKGISTSSMSKVFSLAGLRLGWIATKDPTVMQSCLSHRDYNMISCGMLDETLAAFALAHKDAVLKRSKSIIRENLAILDAWVAREEKVSYVKPQAGTTALLYFDIDISSYEFCENLLRETGAFMTPGECFGLEKCARIGYACDKAELIKGLEQLSQFLRR